MGGLTAMQHRTLMVIGGGTAALVVMNIWLFFSNRSTQVDVAQRQQFINESVQLNRLNTRMVQFLADLAVRTEDQRIRDLLMANGITINANESGEAAP